LASGSERWQALEKEAFPFSTSVSLVAFSHAQALPSLSHQQALAQPPPDSSPLFRLLLALLVGNVDSDDSPRLALA
jgi:hypothetical protein